MLKKWDVVEHLRTEQDMLGYFDACLAENDVRLISAALGDIARARGMAHISSVTGLSRESLYRALSGEGNPEFTTIIKVIDALGLHLRAEVKAAKEAGMTLKIPEEG